MRIGFCLKSLPLYLLILQSTGFLFAQYSGGSDIDYTSIDGTEDSAIPSFYQTLDEKSFYHSRQIRGMKRDLNDHSRNLYDLRRRFDQVFFGRNSANLRGDPFVVGPEQKLPTSNEVNRQITYVPPPPPSGANAIEPRVDVADSQSADENLLAFNVQARGSYLSHDNQVINPLGESAASSGPARKDRFDYYFLPRVSVAYPYKIKRNQGHSPQPHYQRYLPGFSAALSTGIRIDRWRLGIAGHFQENSLHSASWAARKTTAWPKYEWSGETSVTAALFEVSHLVPLLSSFSLNLNAGGGYAWTKSNYDFKLAAASEHSEKAYSDFIWVAGAGLEWSFSQRASLLLSYRYFASEEVPTHNADLGLEFDF